MEKSLLLVINIARWEYILPPPNPALILSSSEPLSVVVAAILNKFELCDHCHLSGEKGKIKLVNAPGNPVLGVGFECYMEAMEKQSR